MTPPGPDPGFPSWACPLCERDVASRTRHHLVPKSRGGAETVRVCGDCHRAIHAFFDNRTLERDLATVEALRADPELSRQFAFIARQPAGRRVRVATRRSRRRR